MIKDHAFFVKPAGSGPEATGVSLQSRVTELESEVARLKEQLGKAKGINDVMWETVVPSHFGRRLFRPRFSLRSACIRLRLLFACLLDTRRFAPLSAALPRR